MEFSIPTPPTFDFRRTAISHGWCELPPFSFDQQTWTITRVLDTGNGQPVTATMSGGRGALIVRVAGRKPGQRALARLTRDVRHIFRLDDDLSEFYAVTQADPEFAWIARQGAGRLLRSPTVYEDLVKALCTTNCSWALTRKMVAGLVNNLGAETKDGRRNFPAPAEMAAAPLEFYRDEVRAGYRAPYFKELAERVASGELDVEAWLTSDLPTPQLKREIKRVKGVGDYAAETLLRLIGRYDVLALDSWVRPTFARLRAGGQPCADTEIARFYARFDAWSGLALWCDMTRDWVETEAPAET